MKKIIAIFTVFITVHFSLLSQDKNEKDNAIPSKKDEIKKIKEGVYKIGGITVDKNNNEVRFSGSINMKAGEIEYMLCSDGGKLHESLLYTDESPTHIQTALILLGLNCKNNLEYQGDTKTPEGDRVNIWIEWKTKDKITRKRADELIKRVSGKKFKNMEKTSWAFSGSKFEEGKFCAEITKSVIATLRDPYAILNNPLKGGSMEHYYSANEKTIPDIETKVEIIISPEKKKKQDKK